MSNQSSLFKKIFASKYKFLIIGSIVLGPTAIAIGIIVPLTKEKNKASKTTKEIDTSELVAASFIVSKNDAGAFVISRKEGVKFPSEITPLYALQKANSDNMGAYSITAPSTLERGDFVFVKFQINDGVQARFPTDFSNAPFRLTIPKRTVATRLLTKNIFRVYFSSEMIDGEKAKRVIIRETITIPHQIQIEAAINGGDFEQLVPERRTFAINSQTLVNDDTLRIRFTIKNAFQATHALPDAFVNVINFKVIDLMTVLDTSKLVAASFVVDRNSRTRVFTINRKADVAFPFGVTPLYARQQAGSSAIGTYEATVPVNLERGDVVFVKFKIGGNVYARFPTNFSNAPFQLAIPKRTVATRLLTRNIFKAYFSGETVSDEKGKIVIRETTTYPRQIQIEAAINGGDFGQLVPERRTFAINSRTLVNDDTLQIRFTIQNAFQTTHAFPDAFVNVISFKVIDLMTVVDTSKLVAASFVVSRAPSTSTFTISRKAGVVFPFGVTPLYSLHQSISGAIGAYSETVPTELKQTDALFVKFKINEESYARFPDDFLNTPFQIN